MIDTMQLRQKILDLAIQGKLVPQNPSDEPASVLIEKIRNEKAALVKAGKIKAPKHNSFIFRGEDNRYYENVDGKVTDISDQIPFEIPDNWQWCRLGNVTPDFQYGTSEKSSSKGVIAVLRMGNLNAGEIDYSDLVYSSRQSDIEKYLLLNGDLLFNRTNSAEHVGKVSIYRGTYPAIFAGYLVRFSPLLLCHDYVNYAMNSSWEHEYCQRVKSDAVNQSNVNAQKLAYFILPIPPLAEQQRIVSCIGQLFAFCDTLDKADADLESTVSLARQKVLDLAIRGQLVPQNPADEPASELLKRIQAEKAAQMKPGTRRADKRGSTIIRGGDNRYYENVNGKATDITDQIPFEIPPSWEWVRLGSLCDYGVCQSKLPSEIPSNCWLLELEDIEKDTGRLLKRVFRAEREASSPKHSFKKGNVLYSKLRTYLNKVLIADMDGCCTSEILPLDFGKKVDTEYARLVLMSSMFLSYTVTCGYGVKMPRLGTEDGRKALFPLPPLPEQQRIVDSTKEYIELLGILK